MRKRLTNNTGLKLLSLISAFIIWLVILSIENPEKTKSLTIDVEIMGQEELEEKGKTYEVDEAQTVTFSIKGKTSVLDSLSSSDFVATADLTQLTVMDTIPITITALRDADQITITQQQYTLPLTIDDLAQETVKVTVTPVGTAAENFSAAGTSASPNMVTVSGPKNTIKNIDKVEVTCDINGYSESVIRTLTPIIYDKNGSVMEGSNIKLDVESVEATVTIFPTKEVPVSMSTVGTPADGYSVTGIQQSQDYITITASPEILEKVEALVIPAIDVSDEDTSIEGTISLSELLKEEMSVYTDVLLADTEDSEIAYTITIEHDKTSSIELPLSDIKIRNQSEELSYTGEDVILNIAGSESEIANTSVSNIVASIDVYGLTEGSHEVPLTISFGTEVKLVSDVNVKIVIKSK